MAEDGELIHSEQQSSAGKWILVVIAIVFVAASVYGYVTTQQHVDKLTKDLSESQSQVGELQKRMRSAEAQEETLGQKLGMTKKELAQREMCIRDSARSAAADSNTWRLESRSASSEVRR